ncbi:Tau-tubulin kinase 1 [Trichinella pseudospiralis]|uniref:Tau-tubulin kinase 1 n=3 Tax=Trichinella pseudospiralis TaxID=6337 RepID=A0A0V1FJU3_TRIPS|nr:Tau-tubulin kinase 1 [Trichinella pseudospiralis]KRY86331.1 Tau-tubulin kinase 1 [Trichinella pseudospiralis]KRY86347.1 Tau-tubulin kinase 1 [Trichinella pseudospiralis]KRZ20504.1 Tau-tubulin kinase 1 [Trichinella pseudospiralis]
MISSDIPLPSVIGNRWQVLQRIGAGGFGSVYVVSEVGDEKSRYAAKIQIGSDAEAVMRTEVKILSALQGKSSRVCQLIACGSDNNVNYIIMNLAGKNLKDYKNSFRGKHLPPVEALKISIQCIEIIREVHEAGFIHRDVKPENFAVEFTGTAEKIYLLDFGLSRQYRFKNGAIRPVRKNPIFYGTPEYASLNAFDEKELGRHDDLISWFYMVVEFYGGFLPWKHCKNNMKLCAKIKRSLKTTEWLKNLPKEFTEIFQCLCKMNYEEEPNYELFIGKLRLILKRDHGINY